MAQQHASNSGNFGEDRERASEAGRKGRPCSHGGTGVEHSSGNCAQDRAWASEDGRKGGQHRHGVS